jgi:hypothetical protein
MTGRFGSPIELPRRALFVVLAFAVLAISLRYVAVPFLPPAWRTAGSPELYLVGVAAAAFLMVPVVFSLVKRCGRAAAPRLWFIAHLLAGSLGLVLAVIHSATNWTRVPAVLVLLTTFLVLQGFWARIRGGDRLAAITASRPEAFLAADPEVRASLQSVIAAKRDLLARLDSGAAEGTFSPTLAHWLKNPVGTLAYTRLARREARLMNAQVSADPVLANWRKVHIAAAYLVVVGLIIHVVTVTFFAGYVAGDSEITWWHLAEWGK